MSLPFQETIIPFYFGAADRQLFGCYHEPQAEPWRDCGVVLCPPMGHEYILAHRTLRQVAVRLAAVGFHVLRFDYYGCGDSAGESDEGSVQQWTKDIATAIDTLRQHSRVTHVSVIGLRLGATLAVLAGAQRCDIDHLVLWDPILDGKTYMAELVAAHTSWLKSQSTKGRRAGTNHDHREILGFPLTAVLCRELQEVNVWRTQQRVTTHLLMLTRDTTRSAAHGLEHLENLAIQADYSHIPGPPFWAHKGSNDQPIIPLQTLHALIAWMSKHCL